MSDYENGADEVKGEGQKSPVKILKGPPGDTISTEDSLEQKISLRMEIMLKKERLKQEEEANYTYKPKLYTSAKKEKTAASPGPEESAATRENRFDKLYGDALKRHITSTLKEEQKDKDLTFTPKVTKRATSASRSNSATRGGGSRSASRERSVRESSADGRSTPTFRKSVEAEKPSFQPAISKRAKSIERSREKEVTDRLYEHGQHLKEKMERKRVETEQKELESCSFAPKIKSDPKRSSSASKIDVVDRMNRFDEIRKKKLEEARESKKETERSLTFQPTLIAKRPTTPTHQQQPFHERLAQPIEKPISHSALQAMSQLTFKPQIISKRSPSPNSARSNDYNSIHERLYREGQEHRRELENELQNKRHELDADLTFQPQIISPSVVPHQGEPVFERLSTAADRQELKQKLARIKSEVTKDWTFQPQISENSRRLVGGRRESHNQDHYERQMAEQRRIEEELQRKKEEQEAERLREATFAPHIPETSKELAKKKISMSNIDTSGDVYSRLATTQSPPFTAEGSASSTPHHYHAASQQNVNNNTSQLSMSRSIILPEKVLSQVFERLATPSVQQMEEYAAHNQSNVSHHKIVVPEREAEQIFNRLSAKKTMSFTFKEHGHNGGSTSSHGSPTAKQQPLTEAALMERIEEEQQQRSSRHNNKDTSSQVSSVTAGSNHNGPAKPRTPSAQKTPSKTTTTTTTATTTSKATKSASKASTPTHAAASGATPVIRRTNSKLGASPMPPAAPPATAVKATPGANNKEYYDDLAKRLEGKLSLLSQADGAPLPAVPSPGTVEVKKKKKEGEEFVASIPTVPDNGELSD